VRDKPRAPRSGDFVRQSPGGQGAAAIGRPLRAPCASDYMKQCT
ncbi:DNA helicase, partial [Shigella flexneri]|nr:DNA helicase [Shigella flexneri]